MIKKERKLVIWEKVDQLKKDIEVLSDAYEK